MWVFEFGVKQPMEDFDTDEQNSQEKKNGMQSADDSTAILTESQGSSARDSRSKLRDSNKSKDLEKAKDEDDV